MTPDTSAEEIGRLADALERSGLTIAAATLRALLAERDAARALLHKALRHADRVSVLLNDIAAEAHRINDERLLALTVRRFSDCSGLDLFIAAEKAGLSARAALAGEGSDD